MDTDKRIGIVQGQHDQLNDLMAVLELELDGIEAGAIQAPDISRLSSMMENFISTLSAHFEFETAHEIYAFIPYECPRFVKAVSSLIDEHESLLTELRRLYRKSLGPFTDDNLNATLFYDIRAVLRQLRIHEIAEREILQRIYTEDIGGSG